MGTEPEPEQARVLALDREPEQVLAQDREQGQVPDPVRAPGPAQV